MNIQEPQETAAALAALLEAHPAPLTTNELARELGDDIAAIDALARLQRAGLVNRQGDLTWASRAARAASELL